MKTIFGKKTQKFISALLVCCMVAGMVGIPMDAKAATKVTEDDLYVHNEPDSGVTIETQDTGVGLKCTYTGSGYSFYNRVGSADVWNMSKVGTGMHLELQDITGRTEGENYTLVLAIGDNNNAGWTQLKGNRAWIKNDHGNAAILAVESDGNYKAYTKGCGSASDKFPTDVVEGSSGVITIGKLQNELDGSISIDIVRKGTNGDKWTYEVTVNGETFEMSTPNYVQNPYINFGLLSGSGANGNMVGASFVVSEFSGYKYNVSLNQSKLSMVSDEKATLTATITGSSETAQWSSSNDAVATVTDGVVTAVAEGNAVITATVPDGKEAECHVVVAKKHADVPTMADVKQGRTDTYTEVTMKEINEGVRVTHKNKGTNYDAWQWSQMYASVSTSQRYSLDEGFHLNISDIDTPGMDDYTFVVCIGQDTASGAWLEQGGWINTNNYLLLYSKNGDYAIVKADNDTSRRSAIKHGNAGALVGDSLSLDIKMKDNSTILVMINGEQVEIAKYGNISGTTYIGLGFANPFYVDAVDTVKSADGIHGVFSRCYPTMTTLSYTITSMGTKKAHAVNYSESFDTYRATTDENGAYTSAPEKAGFVFAGWYTDVNCENEIASNVKVGNVASPYYAKFVPEEVLGVKAQIPTDTSDTSEDTELRFVTSVDCQDYQAVGFRVYSRKTEGLYDDNQQTKSWATIKAAGKTIEPNVFHNTSKALITIIFDKVAVNGQLNSEIKVVPYWVTADGTKICGVERSITMKELLNANASGKN